MVTLTKLIKIIVIVFIIIAVIVLIFAELDRRRPRNIRPPLWMYYKSKHYLTAPVNYYISRHFKRKEDAEPFVSLEHNFSDHDLLKDNWKDIRDEVLNLYQKDGMTKIKGDLFFRKIADDNWKKFYIKWYDEPLEDACNRLPYTTNLIKQLPQIQCAMISVLEPGAIITPHVGPFRGSLRYHLGLLTPNDDDCFIMVDGIKYSWRDGEDVLFDDTFVHEVKNETDKTRIILFCDIKRELDSDSANAILEWSCSVAKITGKGRTN